MTDAPDDLIAGNRAAAKLAGVDERTLRTWVARGKLRKYPDPANPRGVAYSARDLRAVRVVDVGPGERAEHPPAPPAPPADLAPVLAALHAELAAIRAELAALRAAGALGAPPALPEHRADPPARSLWQRVRRLLAGG